MCFGQHTFSYADYNPPELGKVNWIRDYDEAIKKADEQSKPIFLLFQEVPGCSNCTTYGSRILSHPLMVEAIEDLFVPLAIYNNKGGRDAEIRKHFGEPSWNNPVVRIIDPKGINLVSRIADFRSRALLVESMKNALSQSDRDISGYLDVILEEFISEEKGTETMYLSMYCFWTGEKEIARLEGVVGTEAGFMHGHEVVKVNYNPEETTQKGIAKAAGKAKCADEVYSNEVVKSDIPHKKIGKYRKDRQDKYYLLHSPYKCIPMTEYQKALVNSALGSGDNPDKYLSPRQLFLLNKSNVKGNYIEKDFIKAWYSLE